MLITPPPAARGTRLAVCTLVLTAALAGGGARAQETAAQAPASPPPEATATATAATPASTLTMDSVAGLLAAAKSALESVPATPAAGSPEARLRTALERRVALLEEYTRLVTTTRTLNDQQAGLADREKALRAELDKAAQQTTAALDDKEQPSAAAEGPVNKDTLDKVEAALNKARGQASALREAQTQAQQRLDTGIQKDLDASQQRGTEAAKRAELLSGQLAAATDDQERRVLTVQSTNARFDGQVAEQAEAALQAERDYERAAEAVHALELEQAERTAAAMEQRFTALATALQESLGDEKRRAAEELARKERREEQADTPPAKFLAQWETELARSQSSTGDVAALVIPLKKDVAEQEKRLGAEREEDATVRSLIKRSGTSGGAGERINRTSVQLQRRKQVVERTLELGQLRALPALRDRRFEVEDLLIGLAERFNERRDELAASLEGDAKTAFLAAANKLLPDLRAALRAERLALSEAIGLGGELQKLLGERLELLRDLDRFIRTRAFWLRDGKPIGPVALAPVPREIGKFQSWLAALGAPDSLTALTREMTGYTAILFGLLLFPIAPLMLFWARQKLRQVTRRVNDRVVAEGQSAGLLLTTLLTGFMSAALLPLYFLLAARLVASTGLPASIGPVLSAALNHLGLFLFLWFLFRSFFHRRGIAEVQFGMPRAAANAFYSALRYFLFGYLVFLAPSQILRNPPFSFQALPMLAYVLFLITATIAVAALVRRRSAFVTHRLASLNGAWPSQHWGVISTLFIALTGSTVVLHMVGYRTASLSILTATLLTLATLIALPPAYAIAAGLLSRVRSRRHSVLAEVTGEEEEPMEELEGRTHRFLRLLFIVSGAILVASIWGLDQQALATLDELVLYTVRGAGDAEEFVTAGDLVRCLLIIVFTIWTLRTIPGVYEFALFPRLNVDDGVKYALLTITRYSVFVIGVFLALGQAHLDLGRLGWLMAAMGVGLGFGLQEIVSNFVSGIILLVERPVRPGDVVSVGGMTGTVQRINIRATTIVNFDRQEVLVPNRSLITSEVTNWTRGDTTNRVVVLIGVAYGSDVDQVFEILFRLAGEIPEVLKEPAPQVFFVNHGESSLDFEVRLFVPSPSELMRVRNQMNKAINREFAAHGIEIPFPQRDLHIRSGLPPVEATAGTA